jgi:hypothetical protein
MMMMMMAAATGHLVVFCLAKVAFEKNQVVVQTSHR